MRKKLTKREIDVLCTRLADEYIGLDQPDEEWQTIPGYEDYEVSNYGRIYSYRTSKPKLMKGNRMITQVDAGRHYFCLTNEEGTGYQQAIYWMLLAFVGEPDQEDMVACHIDSIRYNDHISNARWGTKADDVRDAMIAGNHRAALSDQEVAYVRASPLTTVALSKILGVSKSCIKSTRRGMRYKHLNEKYPPAYNAGATNRPVWTQRVA